MVIFLLTVVVLSVFMVAGYRLNMYLYTRGVVGISTRARYHRQATQDEPSLMQSMYEMDQQERHYGLRYARIGILLMVGILVALLAGLVVVLAAVFH